MLVKTTIVMAHLAHINAVDIFIFISSYALTPNLHGVEVRLCVKMAQAGAKIKIWITGCGNHHSVNVRAINDRAVFLNAGHAWAVFLEEMRLCRYERQRGVEGQPPMKSLIQRAWCHSFQQWVKKHCIDNGHCVFLMWNPVMLRKIEQLLLYNCKMHFNFRKHVKY